MFVSGYPYDLTLDGQSLAHAETQGIEGHMMTNRYKLLLFLSLSLAISSIANAAGQKKGIGLAESQGLGEHQLKALRVSWYYNWGPQSDIKTNLHFVPMAFRVASSDKLPQNADIVLGFNEPDNSKQSDLSVREALAAWPRLQQHAQTLGAPAMAGNPIRQDSWLQSFMAAAPKVDFMTLHWYKGVSAKKFIADVQAMCDAFHKPVWVTEFAPQTAGDARARPDRYTQAEVDAFIRDSTAWMEQSACVHRYAWHDAKTGTSSLFDGKELSATGRTYAAAGQ